MSFFTHPYHTQQRRSLVHPNPYGFGPAQYGPHPQAFATQAQAQAPQFNFFNGGNDYVPSYDAPSHGRGFPDISIDEEERAAIAHLRSIQRRKEAERIIREEAERERAIAQLQARREAAIAAKVRAHQEREREIALARARIEKERDLAIAQRMREIEIARRHQQHQLALATARAQQEQVNERRRQCAQHCAARRAEQERQTPVNNKADSDNEGLEAFNRFIGSLFGIQLDTDVDEKTNTPTDPATEAKKDEQVATPVPAVPAEEVKPTENPVAAPIESEPATDKPSTAATTEDKKNDFPEVINDVLANFLGLRVEPESKLGQAVSTKVPEGLNELLGQFGLEFVPDAAKNTGAGPSDSKQADTTSTTASTSTAAPQVPQQSRPRQPFDLSDFLKGDNGLPPFVRDILGNVELAFKNEKEEKEPKIEGKGKGVAEGEKKAAPSAPVSASAPAPVPAVVDEDQKSTSSSASIDKLESIASEIKLATDSFTFPSALSFSHNTPTDNVPSLLFNKQNKPYHAQNNKLLQLLLQADGVASNGDREVRRKRKEVVKLVEAELEGLEKKRDEIWRSVKERRENGNESSDDESASWTTGSTVDHEEPVHVEDVTAPAAEQSQVAESVAEEVNAPTTATSPESAQPPSNEKNATSNTFADAVKSAPEATEQEASVDTATEGKTEEKSDFSAKVEEEQGYEVL